jgi:hypothetical protein
VRHKLRHERRVMKTTSSYHPQGLSGKRVARRLTTACSGLDKLIEVLEKMFALDIQLHD